MKKILAVLLAALMLTAAAYAYNADASSGGSIELPDMPLYPEDPLPECNVTAPENYIYKLIFTVKSATARELGTVLPPEKLAGHAPGDTIYYINVRLDDEQYEQICGECGDNVFLCNIALNGKLLPADEIFSYKNTLDIRHQFQILMPDEPSVLTLDYFGALTLILDYQKADLPNDVLSVGPYAYVELPYPESDGKTPVNWNSLPDGSGMVYDADYHFEPVSGKLWRGNEANVTLYAMWEPYDPVIQGDINEDGEIDNKDVVVLFRLLSGSQPDYSFRYDCNNDGSVDNKDVVALFRFISS